MKEISLSGKKREAVGKKATRELRKEGLVPCNLYGQALKDGKPVALSFAVSKNDLRKVVYTPHIYMINLVIDGESHMAILKELQFHPVSDELLHIDFLEVHEDKPIVIGIPVKLTGLAQGVRDGGRLSLSIRKIEVKAVYGVIPEQLEIDVTNLRLGKSIKVGDLHFDNLELVTGKEVIVCSVKMTRAAMSAASATETEDATA